jgi:hypothetical protein
MAIYGGVTRCQDISPGWDSLLSESQFSFDPYHLLPFEILTSNKSRRIIKYKSLLTVGNPAHDDRITFFIKDEESFGPMLKT